MSLSLRRISQLHPDLRTTALGGATRDRFDDAYELVDGDVARWQDIVDWADAASVPFREELVWESAGVAVLGGGACAYFVDLGSGELRLQVEVPSLFGHLALVPDEPDVRDENLLVLGYCDVAAVTKDLRLRWIARDVAIDGIVFTGAEGRRIQLSAEMDPPGDWVDVELDATSGRRLDVESGPEDGGSLYRAIEPHLETPRAGSTALRPLSREVSARLWDTFVLFGRPAPRERHGMLLGPEAWPSAKGTPVGRPLSASLTSPRFWLVFWMRERAAIIEGAELEGALEDILLEDDEAVIAINTETLVSLQSWGGSHRWVTLRRPR